MTIHTVPDPEGLLSEPGAQHDDTSVVSRLGAMPLADLAETPEAARLVARLTRQDAGRVEPVRVAAFNSFI